MNLETTHLECKQEHAIQRLVEDIGDMSIDLAEVKAATSGNKDSLAAIDKSLALLAAKVEVLADGLTASNGRFEKHIEEGRSWRLGVALTALGMAGTFCMAIFSYGALSEKVAHAEKIIEARTFG